MIRFGSIFIFRYVPDTSSVSETLNGLTSNKIHLLIFYKYFSREVTGKFPFIQDTRANFCRLIKEKYLASIMYFYVLFTIHFVKAWNSHTHLVYTP